MEKGANLNLELQKLKFQKIILNTFFFVFPHKNPNFPSRFERRLVYSSPRQRVFSWEISFPSDPLGKLRVS